MPVRKWVIGGEDDQRLINLSTSGRSLNSVAKELGWSTETIHRHARRLGLSWSRGPLVEATLALVADAAALRTALEVDLLRDADRLRRQLFAPAVAFNFGGKDNTFNEHTLPQPSARDQSDIMRAATAAIAHSLKISEHDVNAGSSAAIGMLDKIADGIKLAALDIALEGVK